MKENNILNRNEESAVKVIVNRWDDYILIDPADTSISRRFHEFLAWLEQRGRELESLSAEMEEKYKDRPVFLENEETGETEVDLEQFGLFSKTQCDFFSEVTERIDNIFGQNIIRKYFRASYDIGVSTPV